MKEEQMVYKASYIAEGDEWNTDYEWKTAQISIILN